MNVALVTGTSSGIGLATALRFAREGHRVYAGLRNPARGDRLREAVAGEGLPVEIVSLDVTHGDSIARATGEILEREGRVDVLVNNAGISGAAPLELTPEEEHRAIFDTNYFGAMAMTLALLPSMRERGSGAIVNVSSIAGRICIPNQIAYSASKHALEAACEALAHEVRSLGVRVTLVEPGVFATDIWANSAEATRYDRSSPYKQVMRRNGKMYARLLEDASPPELAADAIFDAATADSPPLRTVVGDDAVRMIEARRSVSDEDWVELGAAHSDEEYARRFKRACGIDL